MDTQLAEIDEQPTERAESEETGAFRERLARIRSRPRPEMTAEDADDLIARERKAARRERDARGR